MSIEPISTTTAMKVVGSIATPIITKALSSDENIKTFKKLYFEIIKEVDKEYEHYEILAIFNKDDIQEEVFKYIFSQSKTLLDTKIDFETLPKEIFEKIVMSLKDKISLSPLNKFLNQKMELDTNQNIEKLLIDIKELLEKTKDIKDNFFDRYRKDIINEFSKIRFFGLEMPSHNLPRENNLNRLYVKNYFSNDNEEIEFENILNLNRVVILGKPGSGKSAFVKYAIVKILENSFDTFENKSIFGTIPIRVELREYSKFKTSKNNLIDYILEYLNSKFNTSYINRDNIDEIFKKLKFILFFDGLDEIFSKEKRAEIRDEIENISNHYPNNYIIITSRIEGYKDTPFNKNFNVYEIDNFTNSQIEEYRDKWLNLDTHDEKTKEELKNKFDLEKSTIDNDLISNPLMLSIILILLSRTFSIPKSKLEIYESCTRTLVEKWEKTKELNVEIDKKLSALAHLAFWQYNNKDNITNEKVLKELERFYEKFEDDIEIIKEKANTLMNYIHQRSIYFDNTFVHKTFLEYFTAYYIYSNYEKKRKYNEQNSLIEKHIEDSYWFVVLSLLISFLDKDQADNEIMEELITNHTKNNDINSIIFFLKNIEYIEHISDKFKRKFIENTIDIALNEAHNFYEKENDPQNRYAIVEVLRNLDKKYLTDIINSLKEKYQNSELYMEFLILSFEFELASIIGNLNFDSENELVQFSNRSLYAIRFSKLEKSFENIFINFNYKDIYKDINLYFFNVNLASIIKVIFENSHFNNIEKFIEIFEKHNIDTNNLNLKELNFYFSIPEKLIEILNKTKHQKLIAILIYVIVKKYNHEKDFDENLEQIQNPIYRDLILNNLNKKFDTPKPIYEKLMKLEELKND